MTTHGRRAARRPSRSSARDMVGLPRKGWPGRGHQCLHGRPDRGLAAHRPAAATRRLPVESESAIRPVSADREVPRLSTSATPFGPSWTSPAPRPGRLGDHGDWVLVAAVAVAATLEATLRADMPLPWLSWLVAVGALAHADVAAHAPVHRGGGRLRRARRARHRADRGGRARDGHVLHDLFPAAALRPVPMGVRAGGASGVGDHLGPRLHQHPRQLDGRRRRDRRPRCAPHIDGNRRRRPLAARCPGPPTRAGEDRGACPAGARAARHRGAPRLRDRHPGAGRARAGSGGPVVSTRRVGRDRGGGVADPRRDADDGAGAAQPGAGRLRPPARGGGARRARRDQDDRAPRSA